jgi:crossover junction endodeoxyribonuclease RuvC
MIILGIDPGTARLGYGIVKATSRGVATLVETDVFITKKETDLQYRLLFLHKSLIELIKKHTPDLMVVERIFFNTNAKTAMSVGQARGVILLAAAGTKTPIWEYTALEAKLALTGYGRSDKKVMQESVKGLLNLENIIKSDDANDAVAMALCYLKKEYLKK